MTAVGARAPARELSKRASGAAGRRSGTVPPVDDRRRAARRLARRGARRTPRGAYVRRRGAVVDRRSTVERLAELPGQPPPGAPLALPGHRDHGAGDGGRNPRLPDRPRLVGGQPLPPGPAAAARPRRRARPARRAGAPDPAGRLAGDLQRPRLRLAAPRRPLPAPARRRRPRRPPRPADARAPPLPAPHADARLRTASGCCWGSTASATSRAGRSRPVPRLPPAASPDALVAVVRHNDADVRPRAAARPHRPGLADQRARPRHPPATSQGWHGLRRARAGIADALACFDAALASRRRFLGDDLASAERRGSSRSDPDDDPLVDPTGVFGARPFLPGSTRLAGHREADPSTRQTGSPLRRTGPAPALPVVATPRRCLGDRGSTAGAGGPAWIEVAKIHEHRLRDPGPHSDAGSRGAAGARGRCRWMRACPVGASRGRLRRRRRRLLRRASVAWMTTAASRDGGEG